MRSGRVRGVRRAVFLDVDGTYAHRGEVPAAHAAAVRAARAAGHVVLLCTGRPKAMLPARILDAGFDGIVAAAGGYVELDGEVLADRRFPLPIAERAVAALQAYDVAFILEAPHALYGPLGLDRRLADLFGAHLRPQPGASQDAPLDILAGLRMSDDLAGASFGKITCFDSPVPVAQLRDEIGGPLGVIPSSIPGMGDSAGEIYLEGVHKGVGMRIAAQHLGFALADVIAFGDGLNDLEMIAAAGVGVAIEGSDPRVLAVADRIAAGPGREGLVRAFTELGLI
jgi:Cof subfamily protein (haloacid dehalogenase superfamily)